MFSIGCKSDHVRNLDRCPNGGQVRVGDGVVEADRPATGWDRVGQLEVVRVVTPGARPCRNRGGLGLKPQGDHPESRGIGSQAAGDRSESRGIGSQAAGARSDSPGTGSQAAGKRSEPGGLVLIAAGERSEPGRIGFQNRVAMSTALPQ